MKKLFALLAITIASSTFAQTYEHDNAKDSDLKSRHARTASRDFDTDISNAVKTPQNDPAYWDRGEPKAEHANPNDSDLKKRHKRVKSETK